MLASVSSAASQTFWNSDLGAIVQTFLVAVGIVVVIIAIMRSITHIHQGKHGQALRLLIGAVVLAVFCFDVTLITDLIDAFTAVVHAVVNTIGNIASTTSNNSTTVNTPSAT